MAKRPWGVLILHGFTSSLDCVKGIEPPLKDLGLATRMPVLSGHGAPHPRPCAGSPGAIGWPMPRMLYRT